MTEWYFRQEYLCEFEDADTAVFASDWIDRAFTKVEPWSL
jgi:hypothetical protein